MLVGRILGTVISVYTALHSRGSRSSNIASGITILPSAISCMAVRMCSNELWAWNSSDFSGIDHSQPPWMLT